MLRNFRVVYASYIQTFVQPRFLFYRVMNSRPVDVVGEHDGPGQDTIVKLIVYLLLLWDIFRDCDL